MPDIETTTTNDETFTAENHLGEYALDIDAQGRTAPSPNEVLVADYASCFTFAFRAGAMRNDYDDLGQIQTEAEANLDDEDDLTDVSFTMLVEAELSDDEIDDLLDNAEDICHVHAALRQDLHADVTVESGAF
ncbi:OsmC family protein [Halorientalis brevis]|uniref:OsmC family protein n=1 Tax=Halorientalis brevis TaxID=1126241 RepID=A0ABD6CF44_9EURY|nr:OsmC family protein [Halorientalis brevis]